MSLRCLRLYNFYCGRLLGLINCPRRPTIIGYLSLSYLPQDDPRNSRNLLQTLFEFIECYNELIWDKVTFIIAALTAQAYSSREDDVAQFGIVEREVQLLQEITREIAYLNPQQINVLASDREQLNDLVFMMQHCQCRFLPDVSYEFGWKLNWFPSSQSQNNGRCRAFLIQYQRYNTSFLVVTPL